MNAARWSSEKVCTLFYSKAIDIDVDLDLDIDIGLDIDIDIVKIAKSNRKSLFKIEKTKGNLYVPN